MGSSFAKFMQRVAAFPVDDNELLRHIAATRKSAAFRCHLMIDFLQRAAAQLEEAGTPPAARKVLERDIDRMWKAHRQNQPSTGRQTVRELAALIDSCATLYDATDPKWMLARRLFAYSLADINERAAGRLDANVLALAEQCAATWHRGPGAPTARDRRQPKWEAFAQLVAGLGIGKYDADALKKECSPARRKKRRSVTP
jgi:hypothetical protein